MLKKIFLPSIFLVLTYGFWLSPNFKEVSAGVAIFLFGMLSLEEGFKVFTGGTLEKILRVSTNTRWKSISFGVITTTIMQSSSLVSIITISFLSAGLLGLAEGIGIVFGANLGTTTGAWLVAGLGLKVKISAYAMPMLVFGIIMVFQENKALKGVGYILSGLGFLFLGIHYMKEGFEAFKGSIDLSVYAIPGYLGLFVFVGIGIAATIIMQSSHATLVLIITALAASQITYENALALAIGANVGTTITAILGAMSAGVEGKRLAGAHLIFNLVTGLIAIVFINQFMVAVDWTSNQIGIANDNYTLKLAVFHTLFNLVGVLVMLPFINSLVVFLEERMKDKRVKAFGAKYLHTTSVDFPETAAEVVRKETIHIFELSSNILAAGISLSKKDIIGKQTLEDVVHQSTEVIEMDLDTEYEIKIKGIYSEIIAFISKAAFTWEVEQSASIYWLRSANQDIVEAVKDMKHLRKNMSKNIVSKNKYLKEQYNLLRIQIAMVLRELDRLKNEETVILSIDALKLAIKANHDKLNITIIKLLQKKRITSLMATSLMNDSQYTLRISNNLITMGETLFANYDEDEISLEREVALDSHELEDIALSSIKKSTLQVPKS